MSDNNKSQVDTAGGAYTAGNVNTGRDFAGRDIIYNITVPQSIEENKAQEYQRLLSLILDRFQKWEEANCIGRASNLIEYTTFRDINKFRSELAHLDTNKITFLFRCAVQNGTGGEWGKWLLLNKDNVQIVRPLIFTLNGAMGWLPIWRSAYILECTFGQQSRVLLEKVDPNLPLYFKIKFALNIIAEQGVIQYLSQIAESEDSKANDAIRLLDEIQGFSKEIEGYRQEQLVSNQWFNSLNDQP